MNEPAGVASQLGRRQFLTITGGLAAALSVGVTLPAIASAEPRTSANGWPIHSTNARSGTLAPQVVEGSEASVVLLSGSVSIVLLHVARRFHYEIGTLKAGDITGYTTDTVVSAPFETNYRSGTAIAIRPAMYPAGAENCLFPHEIAIVRDILAECEGVVRWGGDDKKTPKEGHFQIDVKPRDAALDRVVRKIAGWGEEPGKGAGVQADPFAIDRRRVAQDLAESQIATS